MRNKQAGGSLADAISGEMRHGVGERCMCLSVLQQRRQLLSQRFIVCIGHAFYPPCILRCAPGIWRCQAEHCLGGFRQRQLLGFGPRPESPVARGLQAQQDVRRILVARLDHRAHCNRDQIKPENIHGIIS